jgi:hypothetical protein
MTWNDQARRLSFALAPGSRMIAPLTRQIDVRVAGSTATKRVAFSGKPIDLTV